MEALAIGDRVRYVGHQGCEAVCQATVVHRRVGKEGHVVRLFHPDRKVVQVHFDKDSYPTIYCSYHFKLILTEEDLKKAVLYNPDILDNFSL